MGTLESPRITAPNHWREEQKGEVARQTKLHALLNKIRLCTMSDEVVASLSAISEFVAKTETLIPVAQLKRVGPVPEPRGGALWHPYVHSLFEAS